MREKDNNKAIAIRKCAIKMIVDEGFAGISIRKVAEKANICPASIYTYFRDKQDMLDKLYLEIFNETNRASIQMFSPEMSLEKGLKTLWLNRFRYSIENPYEAMFLDQFINSPLVHSVTSEENHLHKDMMKAFYYHAIEHNELKKIPVKVYWSIAFYPLFQMIKFAICKGAHPATNEDVNEGMLLDCLSIIIKGLRP